MAESCRLKDGIHPDRSSEAIGFDLSAWSTIKTQGRPETRRGKQPLDATGPYFSAERKRPDPTIVMIRGATAKHRPADKTSSRDAMAAAPLGT